MTDINIEGIYIYALKDEEQIIFSTTGEKIIIQKIKVLIMQKIQIIK